MDVLFLYRHNQELIQALSKPAFRQNRRDGLLLQRQLNFKVSSMGACLSPAYARDRTGLSAAIFFTAASRRKKGFPLQSLARKTGVPPGGGPR
jgi:hypothetical protein